MTFGDKLSALRREQNYTQEQLADLLGVSRQSVSKWESGQSTPDLEKLVQLADYFQVSTDYLLGRREYTKTARAAQTCHSQDETLTKIIHGLLQLPEDRRQALALIIGDMEQRAAAPNEGGSK